MNQETEPNMIDHNAQAQRIHEIHANWWKDPATGQPKVRNKKNMLMMVVTELAEAVEGERKNLMDDKLPHRLMAEVEMADAAIRIYDFMGGWGYKFKNFVLDWQVPSDPAEAILEIVSAVTAAAHYVFDYDPAMMGQFQGDVELWLSQAMSRIEIYCKKHGYDLQGAIEEKLVYNQKRDDHKLENRAAEHGKKF